MAYWHLIQPVERQNLIQNPSAELGLTDWAGTAGGTLNRVAGTSQYGAWAFCSTPTANTQSGFEGGTFRTGLGSAYTVSFSHFGAAGSPYRLTVQSQDAGVTFQAGFTGAGSWVREAFRFSESGALESTKVLKFVKSNDANTQPFYIDGIMAEQGSVTTYIDGDQDGCRWDGAPHASTSSRSGTSRAGGSVVSLQSLGLTVLEHGGVGMPPVANIMQEYAIADGALWQRQRATARVFTITGLMSGTTWPGLHAIRSTLVDALKIDRSPNPQPFRLLYTGAGGTAAIDAYYDGGMEMESRRGFTETTAIRLLAPDPYWQAMTDAGTQLKGQDALGSANFLMYRDPAGRWGTFGALGTTFGTGALGALAVVRALAFSPAGTLFVGGDFVTAGGTRAVGVAQYAGSRWGTLGPGTLAFGILNVDIYALEYTTSGTLFVGGDVDTAGGTAARFMAQWTSAGWGTLTGGTVNNQVEVIRQLPDNSLAVGGDLTTAGGTTARRLARYNGAWGTFTGGTVNPVVDDIVVMGDNDFIVAGAGTADGTATGGVARWTNGAWGTLGGGAQADALSLGDDGVLYAGGGFVTTGSGSAAHVAAWNGAQWQPMGAGLDGNIYDIVAARGWVYAVGVTDHSGSVALQRGAARWNGASWLPLDVLLPSNAVIPAVPAYRGAVDNAGTFYLGGGFFGTAHAASLRTLYNTGAANAYPVLRVTNTGAGTAKLVQLLNTTTTDAVYFNLALLPNEMVTLDLRPGQKTLTSTTRGNLLGAVLPGSNLTTWKLAPGTNTVSFFASSGTVEAAIYWRPRAWSADAPL